MKQTMQKEQLRLAGITNNGNENQVASSPIKHMPTSSAGPFGQQPLLSQSRLSNLQKIRQAAKQTIKNMKEAEQDDGSGLQKALNESKISE